MRIVAVHGTRFSASQWQHYPALLPDHDLIAVDLPGHGRRAGQRFSMDYAVDVVADAVAGRPAIVAGHSLGGYVATAYAARHRSQLRGLALIGASAEPSEHPILRRLYTGFAGLVGRVGPARAAACVNRILTVAGVGESQLPGVAGYEVVTDAWNSVIAGCGARQLTGLRVPVLIVNGQFDQMRIDATAYAHQCALSRIVTVKGATHLLPLTHPGQVAAALNDLAARADSR
ncbi:MAG: alpha/beta fold hydrolase [Arachnia sp.]